MDVPGRLAKSLALVALLVVPPQVTIVPLLKLFIVLGLNGTVPAVWVYQIGFTIPFGIFLVRGFIASIPEELFESAILDGATVLQTFNLVVLPLCAPILASLAILQFLWSWNDLLIPLIFLGGSSLAAPITVAAAGIATTNGQDQTVLMAATLLSVLLPLVVLLTMQRYFVRGILGGAVKG
jgi:alpha-glucoside transport system permease protein